MAKDFYLLMFNLSAGSMRAVSLETSDFSMKCFFFSFLSAVAEQRLLSIKTILLSPSSIFAYESTYSSYHALYIFDKTYSPFIKQQINDKWDNYAPKGNWMA